MLGSVALLCLFLGGGCSVKRLAVKSIADSLAAGPSTFEADDDIALVGGALPFALKLFETMLAETPRHPGLLLATSKAFTMYTYAYVHFEAERAAITDWERAELMRKRARRLYMRAFGYGLRSLAVINPRMEEGLTQVPSEALEAMQRKHVPFLYWCAASLGLSISVSREEVGMLARIPEVEALIDRALELDESWGEGALHEFRIVLAGARLGLTDEERRRLESDYKRALELSGGLNAGLYVSYAETSCVSAQDRAGFKVLLEKALAVDVDRNPDSRLANLVAQRRARWLLGRIDELFLGDDDLQDGGGR